MTKTEKDKNSGVGVLQKAKSKRKLGFVNWNLWSK